MEWLSSPPVSQGCGTFSGRDQEFSSPANPGEETPKEIRRIFRVTRFEPSSGPGRSFPFSLRLSLEKWREKVDERLLPVDPFGIWRSLLIGDRPADAPEEEGLRLLGWLHLFHASGVHLLGLLAASRWVISRLGKGLGLNPLGCRRAWEGSGGALIFIAWALSGFRLGLLRPILVLGLRALAERAGLRWRKLSPLFVAVGLEWVISLFGGEGLRFWDGRISYALAVGAGVLALDRDSHLVHALACWALASLWECGRTHLLSLSAPLLSWVCIPLIAGIVFPALLADAIGIGLGLTGSRSLDSLLSFLQSGIQTLLAKSLPLPTLWLIPLWSVLLASALSGVALVCAKRSRAMWTLLGFCLLIRAAGSRLTAPPDSDAFAKEVIQLDVGQGDAAWVRSERRSGLIDTGPRGALSDGAWLRFLASQGARRIDWIAITHLDADHVGGIEQLARIVPIGCIEASQAELLTERGREDAALWRESGIRVGQNCMPFPLRHPGDRRSLARSPNNSRMSAYWIPLGLRGFYLSAGDAEAPDEPPIARWAERLSESRGIPREALQRIVKLCHHGSKTSTSVEWLKILAPSEVWISAGIGNRYGHPSAETLARVRESGIPLKRTDRDGALRAEADPRRR